MSSLRSALALMFIVMTFSMSPSAASDAPASSSLRVGQTAYLAAQSESDNEPNTRPVCRSVQEIVALYHFEINDCPHRKWGTIVVITEIEPGFDDDKTSAFSKDIPFAKIRSRSGGWTGWVQSISLEPLIPIGTELVLQTSGNATPSVYLQKHDPINSNIGLGSPVTVQVLQQDPPTTGDCSLFVEAMSGPKRGMRGWSCDDGLIKGTKIPVEYLH